MNTEILENEYRKIWGHDTNMIDYCMKKTACMLELEGGYIFTLDKPSIKTDFRFGYGQNGISTEADYRDAAKSAKNAQEKDCFFAANMENAFSEIEKIMEEDVFIRIKYYRQKNDSVFVTLHPESYFSYFPGEKEQIISKISDADKQKIRKEIELQKVKFTKRLETYWKRYGSSKLTTRTYLVD